MPQPGELLKRGTGRLYENNHGDIMVCVSRVHRGHAYLCDVIRDPDGEEIEKKPRERR